MRLGAGLRSSRGQADPHVPRPVPWKAPRYELALLALVALVALAPVYHATDASRVCLAEALVHGQISNNTCFLQSFDRSRYGSKLYSDKAPGLSLIELPSVALLEPGLPTAWPRDNYWRLWGVRLLSVGIAFVLLAWIVGRTVEGLVPGTGGAALVTFSLGTMMAPLAATSYEHVVSGLLGFSAFLLAWRRRPLLAGLAGGAALLVDYESALMIAVIGVYLAARGLRALPRYGAGLVPGVVLLAAYDWLAFGAPWRLSYHYVDNVDAGLQSGGFFGIGVPRLFGIVEVFAGRAGLLVISPVLVLAAYGLVRLFRERPAEALVCGAVTLGYLLVNVGYFQPYGGETFGPRFVAPALPFLALGLGPAFRALPRWSSVSAAASVVASVALMLVWASHAELRQTVWGELARVPSQLGHSLYVENLTPTLWSQLGLSVWGGALVVAACALAALVLALRALPWAAIRSERGARRRAPSMRRLLVATAGVYLVAVADVCAVSAYPYGDRTFAVGLPALTTSIQSTASSWLPGAEVDFVISIANGGPRELIDVFTTIDLPRGMKLLGAPYVAEGIGCNGARSLDCYLITLDRGKTKQIRFGVTLSGSGNQTLVASSVSDNVPGANTARYTVQIER